MSELTTPSKSITPAIPFLRGALIVTAIAIFAGSCIIAGVILSDASQHAQPTPQTVVIAFATILLGLLMAAGLCALSAIVSLLASAVSRLEEPTDDLRPAIDRLEQSLRMLNSQQERPESAVRATTDGLAPAAATNHLLEQVRDLSLMDEFQRNRFAARHWARRKQIHTEAIERDVLVGDWRTAFARLDELQVVLPEDVQIAELRERVESEQNARLDEDLRNARTRVRTLISAANWQHAEDLVAALQNRYPGKAEPARLAEDVRREREAFDRETMERLFRDISAATSRHQWRQAILAVDEFIRRYPIDPRADALRLDLPMLQENAAAQERKEQESTFKDLLKRQRYEEAISVARNVIQKYPQSPTATELNKLLPRVEEMARQEAARVSAQNGAGVPANAA